MPCFQVALALPKALSSPLVPAARVRSVLSGSGPEVLRQCQSVWAQTLPMEEDTDAER